MSQFHAHHKPENRETRWLTPRYIVNALKEFDLDPCGAPGHNLAKQTYLLENGDDGLLDPWHGRVWLNPPYGRQSDPFLRRLADHGRGTALIFARTDTRIWHNTIWPKASALLFFQGRLTFLDSTGAKALSNSGAPSVLVTFGQHDADILRHCELDGMFIDLTMQRKHHATHQ